MWKRSVSKLLYTHKTYAYNTVFRRSFNANPNTWCWLRTQYGYLTITNKTNAVRKTDFSGGAPSTKWKEIDNSNGTVSFQVEDNPKFVGQYLSVTVDRLTVDSDENKRANLEYNDEELTWTIKSNDDLNGAQLYFNKGKKFH